MKKVSCLILVILSLSLHAREGEEPIEPLKLGNLALPPSQWQAPLFSFGQLIVGKDELLGWIFTDYIQGENGQMFSAISGNFLYGMTQNSTIAVTVPFVIQQRDAGIASSGVQGFFVDLEYAYYTKVWDDAQLQGTVIGTVGVPLGLPPVSFASPAFLLGTTLSYLSIDWYAFNSYGVQIFTAHNNTRFGTDFLYECGLGHHIINVDGFVIAFVIELDGLYARKDKVCGICDPNSGGNSIALGPSFWIATEKIVIQPGIQAYIQRHLNGNQDKNRFIVSLDVAYSF